MDKDLPPGFQELPSSNFQKFAIVPTFMINVGGLLQLPTFSYILAIWAVQTRNLNMLCDPPPPREKERELLSFSPFFLTEC